MKKIFTSSWCDWPGCADKAIAAGIDTFGGQQTRGIQTWFYPPGKGHKPRVISNDLCEEHFAHVVEVRDNLKVNGELGGTDPLVSNGRD